MRVSDLFIYPLKSARGIALPSTEIDAYGLPGDRRAMVTDADGHFITQRELPALARIDVRPEAGAFRLLMQGKPRHRRTAAASRPAARCHGLEIGRQRCRCRR